jgi:SAM-dependent methyltransferase
MVCSIHRVQNSGEGTRITSENMDTNLTSLVLSGYMKSSVVDRYTKSISLWPEEEYIFEKYFKAVGSVLDIGCGAGRTSFYVASLDNTVTAIDISPKLIDAALDRQKKEKSTVTFKVEDVCVMQYAEGKFDGVFFSYNGIESVPRLGGKTALLKNIHAVLTSDGYFFFTAHNPYTIDYLWRTLYVRAKIYVANIFHVSIREVESRERYYGSWRPETPYLDIHTKSEWERMLHDTGFTVEYCNSKSGIRGKRPFTFPLDYISGTNCFFFVCKKT